MMESLDNGMVVDSSPSTYRGNSTSSFMKVDVDALGGIVTYIENERDLLIDIVNSIKNEVNQLPWSGAAGELTISTTAHLSTEFENFLEKCNDFVGYLKGDVIEAAEQTNINIMGSMDARNKNRTDVLN